MAGVVCCAVGGRGWRTSGYIRLFIIGYLRVESGVIRCRELDIKNWCKLHTYL
jgi:hypothetical protein